MEAKHSTARPALRLGAAAVAIVAGTVWLSGCVAGGGGASMFGFTPDLPVADAAAAAIAPDDVAGPEAGTTTVAETATAEDGVTETAAPSLVADAAEPPPAAQEEVAASTSSSPALDAARTPAMVAFAAPNPPARSAGRSLYASLFTESEARTPVRNADAGKTQRVVVTQTDGAGKPPRDAALPGVDPSSLFEIGQRTSMDDPDFLEDIGGSYQTASLSGMARLAPSGFLVQRDDIVTNCFDSALVGLLGQIERRFGEKVVITSGYRSPQHNRRVNGAKASMHMACKAADLHVPGVSGSTVAAFVRSLPNRGGVGTYCHTAAVHVDVGSRRDWNWACRRRG